jgi:hypothetical protein
MMKSFYYECSDCGYTTVNKLKTNHNCETAEVN